MRRKIKNERERESEREIAPEGVRESIAEEEKWAL